MGQTKHLQIKRNLENTRKDISNPHSTHHSISRITK